MIILKKFICYLCILSLLLSVFCISSTAAESENVVTLVTPDTAGRGDINFCEIYIESTESLAALEVAVHYDNAILQILDIYNQVPCILYDDVKKDSSIQISYIFDGEGNSFKTALVIFSYQILDSAELGSSKFEVTVGEAYDANLNDVNISGSQRSFTVSEEPAAKVCWPYGTEEIYSSVEKEFSVSYGISPNQIASGSAVINYDPELFEVIDVKQEGFLSDKIVDINTSFAGSVYLSFVGDKYNEFYDWITVRFRVIKNAECTSGILFRPTELCDLDLTEYICSEFNTAVSLSYDSSYTGDAPKMIVSALYDENTAQVTAVITLEEDSKLGAGDFVVTFDSTVLTLNTYEKGFAPNFFNVNDKKKDEGVLKFSIISLDDITTAEQVMTLVFDVIHGNEITDIEIGGSMLSDSLTNSIKLNFIGCKVDIPNFSTAQYISGDITSYISDNETVTVRLLDISGNEVASVQTISGGYSLSASAGEYTLEISKNDHVTRSYPVTLGTDNITLDVKIHPKGDINGDGKVNTADVGRANAHAKKTNLLDGYAFACADVNGDGKVNTADVGRMNAHAKKTNLLW